MFAPKVSALPLMYLIFHGLDGFWNALQGSWESQRATGCSLNIVFFPRILESLPTLYHQHSAAIGCTKNYQPIGVTVHSHCVESFEGLLQRCRRGRGCSELWKNTIFPEHPVVASPFEIVIAPNISSVIKKRKSMNDQCLAHYLQTKFQMRDLSLFL